MNQPAPETVPLTTLAEALRRAYPRCQVASAHRQVNGDILLSLLGCPVEPDRQAQTVQTVQTSKLPKTENR